MIKTAFDSILAENEGVIDVLVTNAGIWSCGEIEETTEEEFDRIMGINVKGAYFSIANVIPGMKKAGGGKIVIIGSDQSVIGKPEQNVYGMTKAALGQLAKSCGAQYAPLGINVNCICPGMAPRLMSRRNTCHQIVRAGSKANDTA